MKSVIPRLLAVLAIAMAAVAVACEGGSDINTEEAESTVRDAANNAQQQAEDAWASLRTDGERLIDEVQTRNDPEAKDQLLNSCRDAEQRLRENDNANADRVNEFCDSVRDGDPNDTGAWERIKSEFQQLRNQIQS